MVKAHPGELYFQVLAQRSAWLKVVPPITPFIRLPIRLLAVLPVLLELLPPSKPPSRLLAVLEVEELEVLDELEVLFDLLELPLSRPPSMLPTVDLVEEDWARLAVEQAITIAAVKNTFFMLLFSFCFVLWCKFRKKYPNVERKWPIFGRCIPICFDISQEIKEKWCISVVFSSACSRNRIPLQCLQIFNRLWITV